MLGEGCFAVVYLDQVEQPQEVDQCQDLLIAESESCGQLANGCLALERRMSNDVSNSDQLVPLTAGNLLQIETRSCRCLDCSESVTVHLQTLKHSQ